MHNDLYEGVCMSRIVISSDRMYLKTSDLFMAKEILAFHIKNRRHFTKWEALKSEEYYTLKYTAALIRYEDRQFKSAKEIAFWLTDREKNDGKVMGRVSVFGIIPGNYSTAIVGYKIDEDYEGKGYAKEAMKAVERFLYEELGIRRLEALILPENERSVGLVKSLGYNFESVAEKIVEVSGIRRDHLRFYKILGE